MKSCLRQSGYKMYIAHFPCIFSPLKTGSVITSEELISRFLLLSLPGVPQYVKKEDADVHIRNGLQQDLHSTECYLLASVAAS